MNTKISLAALTFCFSAVVFAQEDQPKNPFTISGYAETYFQYDANNPDNNTRPGFIYSHNRNNEVSLNLGFVKANYETEKVRANLALAAGSYMNANYAAEPGVLKNIYEANVGFKVGKSQNLWITAGILPSHIGYESAVGADCFTLTRSIMAENSPYFEAGAKITYISPSGQWELTGLYLNGWQRIQRVDGNTTPGFGHQIVYRPSSKFSLNSSSFIGNDKPDDLRQKRYFHDFYVAFDLTSKVKLLAGFDMGWEQAAPQSDDFNKWCAASVMAQLMATEKLNFALRGEYYQDKKGVIIATGTQNGFETYGISLNADYKITPNLMWRTEVKNYSSEDAIFAKNTAEISDNSFSVVTSLAIKF
ncbi:porin [Flavobacterium tegetincola]|uniref:porin n=1 Tax=Flavobacterium tegetincola TaxID=150172 RepID=UPI0004182C5A|nr:porin [Flavobacterium tegetincola]